MIIVLGSLLSPSLVLPSHSATGEVTSAGQGLVCIAAAGATDCPASPPILTGPLPPTMTQLRVPIFISGSDSLSGFDITLIANHTIIRPAGADLTNSTLPGTLTIIEECIGGVLKQGVACSATDTIDTIHFVVAGTLTTPPTTGLLFTAIYNITGTTTGTTIGYQTGCTNTSVSGGVCITIGNGSTLLVKEKAQTGFFSNLPFFTMKIFPATLSIPQGISFTATVTVTSLNNFIGAITLAGSEIPPGLTVTFSRGTLMLGAGGLNSTNVTVNATTSLAAGNYNLTLTAGSGTLVATATVPIVVTGPDFSISANPDNISLIAGQSGNITVTVTSLIGFTGMIAFTDGVSPSGPALSFTPPFINLSAGETARATLTVSTKLSPLGFYNVTVTATSGNIIHSLKIVVAVTTFPHGPANFTVSANPSFLTLQAGTSGNSTITATSQLGFTGNLNLTLTVFPLAFNGGPVASLQPPSLVLSSGGSAISRLVIFTSKMTVAQTYTYTVQTTSGTLTYSTLVSVQVLPPPDVPPVASFTFSPTNPVVGQDILFDGSGSFDPDGVVRLWTWDFGDASGLFNSPFPNLDHTYFAAGNYSVTLTVQDNAGLTGSKSMSISVRPPPPHDVAIVDVRAFPQTVVSSQNVGIQVQLRNDGLNNETVSLTAYANGQAVQTLRGIFLPACHPGPFGGFFCFGFFEEIAWDTTGTAPGNYTISASVSLPAGEVDPTPAHNSLTDGVVTVLPPPIITLNPNNGIVGTKVLVTGTGFPLLTPFEFGPVGIVQVSFDNMFLGFTFTHNGNFTFTLDVIEAQPGTHRVIALDQATGAHAMATFTVLPTPTGSLAVTVNVGTIYFPGDTATAYVLTTFNGVPVGPSNVELQLLLFLPNGTSITLATSAIGTGLYRGTFTIPKTGPLGTYAVLAKAHESGPFDASALTSFEVKLSWVSANARSIAGAATAAGLIGLVAVAWKKGYLRRKNEAPDFSSSELPQ